jgi:hypothetical protein
MTTEPEWMQALRAAVERMGGVAPVARLLDYSRPAISRVLHGSYSNTAKVRDAVERLLLHPIQCPGLNQVIDTATCQGWRSRPFDASNHVNVAMYRACRACPRGEKP